MHTGIVHPFGPSSHFWINFGSVWARYTASGGAVKCLVTINWVSPSVLSVILLIVFFLYCFFHLWFFHPLQNFVEAVVVCLQGVSQHGKPLVHRFNTRIRETTRTLRALNSANDQSCIFEHLQVLRDCGLCHLERLCQFIDGGLPLGKTRKNRATRRVCHSRKGSI